LKHSFIDKYSDLDSPVHRLDPRIKTLTALCLILIIVSETRGELFPFLFYIPVIGVIAAVSRIPWGYIMKRCLVVAPFILLTALFYPLSGMLTSDFRSLGSYNHEYMVGISIFLKAYSALILLIVLTSTEKFHNILLGLRKLKMPKLIGIISALMYRYVFLIHDEILRTNMARDSRTTGKLKMSRLKVYGNQSAMVFVRSFERSQTLYNSMLSRGFNGEFPSMSRLSLKGKELLFAGALIMLVLAIRLANQNIQNYLFN